VAFLRYSADVDEESLASALGMCRGTVAATLHRVHSLVLAVIREGGLGDRPVSDDSTR
jgi:hypothetical protein